MHTHTHTHIHTYAPRSKKEAIKYVASLGEAIKLRNKKKETAIPYY